MLFEQWQQPADWAQRISERSAHEGQRKTTRNVRAKQRKTTDNVTHATHRYDNAPKTFDNAPKSTEGVTLRNVEARIARYRRALLDGLVDYDTGAAELRRLEAELDSLEEPSQRVDNALFASEQLSDIRDLWVLMWPEEQQ